MRLSSFSNLGAGSESDNSTEYIRDEHELLGLPSRAQISRTHEPAALGNDASPVLTSPQDLKPRR